MGRTITNKSHAGAVHHTTRCFFLLHRCRKPSYIGGKSAAPMQLKKTIRGMCPAAVQAKKNIIGVYPATMQLKKTIKGLHAGAVLRTVSIRLMHGSQNRASVVFRESFCLLFFFHVFYLFFLFQFKHFFQICFKRIGAGVFFPNSTFSVNDNVFWNAIKSE